RTHSGPIAVECWQKHCGERALVSRLRAVESPDQRSAERALDGGMRLAAVKVSLRPCEAFWISHDIPDPPWASRAGARYSPYPKKELVGLAGLPLELHRRDPRAEF